MSDRNPAGFGAEVVASLLWPDGTDDEPRHRIDSKPDFDADLDLEEIVRALADTATYRDEREQQERFAREVLTDLCSDPAVIAYRQEVFVDLASDSKLRSALAGVLPSLNGLTEVRLWPGESASIQDVPRRLSELELFVDAATTIVQALEDAPVKSRALNTMRRQLQALTGTEEFRALAAEIPELRKILDQARSITIGVNLSPDLMPESAAILSISPERIEGRHPILGRLLGARHEHQAITPLRSGITTHVKGQEVNAFTQDLRRLVDAVADPVARALARYTTVNARVLARLGSELAFFLNAVALSEKLRAAGLSTCVASIAPPDERVTTVEDGYNVSLTLRILRTSSEVQPVVTNAVTFDDATARIWIFTGPNRGGKTTYTQTVGQAHVLFQAGLFVPGRSARLSSADAILTHFPTPEANQTGTGKLDEEAERLAAIFRQATPRSLVLLNEVLAGTSAAEAAGLASETVRGLRLLGARAIYVTHLHDLATRCAEINKSTPGSSAVGSLVAEAESESESSDQYHRRTYRVRPGSPIGMSYASEIAEQHGISFRQLVALFRERGISLPEADGVLESP